MLKRSTAYFGVLLCLGIAAWLYTSRVPKLYFIRKEPRPDGPVLVFQVVNHTNRSFSFYGTGPNDPHFRRRIRVANEWENRTRPSCGNCSQYYTIAPRSKLEFAVPEDALAPNDYALQVGVHFIRGNAAQAVNPHLTDVALWRLRRWLTEGRDEPEPTWSSVVQIRRQWL